MRRLATIVQNGQVTGIIHGPDVFNQLVNVNGREWRFDFDERFGPNWLRKDGADRKCQNPNKAVWKAFEEWHREYRKQATT